MKKQKNLLYSFILLLLLGVSVLSVVFGILMYRTNLLDTYENMMRASLTDTIQKLRYGVSFGKTIENYYGAEKLLREPAENTEYIEALYVTDESKNVLYSSGSEPLLKEAAELEAEGRKVIEGRFYAAFSLDGDSLLISEMEMGNVNSRLYAFAGKLLLVAGLGFLGMAGIISLLWFGFVRRRKKTGFLLCTAVVLWIVLLGIYVGSTCWKEYRMSHKMLAKEVEKSVLADIERLEQKGIPRKELSGLEDYLELYADHISEFQEVHLENGRLEYTVSPDYVRSVFIQYLLNTILLSALSILIVTECRILLGEGKKNEKKAGEENTRGLVRLAFFLLYACISIGKAVNATVSRQLAAALQGQNMEMLTSVPATASMAGAILGIFLSGWLVGRVKNIRRYLQAVLLCTTAGLVFCAASTHLYAFAAARGVLGFCEGLLLIGVKNYAYSFSDSKDRISALSYVNGGVFGGMCLGSVMGGMLCDHLPWQTVFLISAAALLLSIPVLKRVGDSRTENGQVSVRGICSVLKNFQAVRYLFCLVFPVYAGAVFLDYVLPLAGSDLGFTHTVVSALILFNCLLAGYASPVMTRIVSRVLSPERGAVCYCILYAGMILTYGLTGSRMLLAAVTLGLGLCDSFGLVLISEGFILTRGKHKYRDGEANVVFTISSRGGQLIAPGCIALFGGCTVLAGMMAAGLGIYGITGKRKRKGDMDNLWKL